LRGSGPRREKGFTLLEVVIAIAIVGVLAAFAISTYRNYLVKNKEDIAISDIFAIESKLKMIFMEDRSALPDTLNNLNALRDLNLIDPWGNPYQYLKLWNTPGNLSQARKDHSLHPINSDFDLYSMGPDGQSQKPLQNAQSRDDIIRANDGAFVGKASTYDP
jgi:general secretion pathway protein G